MWPRLLYLLDIAVFIAVNLLLDAAVGAIPGIDDFKGGWIITSAEKVILLLFLWGWLRWRGDDLATIGLKKPERSVLAPSVGVITAAVLFVAVHLIERAGYHRDLSSFAPLHGDLAATLIVIGGVIVGAGFGEEFVFRGFFFHRLAQLFGGSKIAWGVALFLQAALFGLAHSYQNPFGMLLTGSIGLILGILFLACGRNLWPPIIAHALYDTARVTQFYLHGPPS